MQMEGNNSVWSGTIISDNAGRKEILTIIHENSSRSFGLNEKAWDVYARLDNKRVKASLKKWDGCSELALFEVDSEYNIGSPPSKIGENEPKISEELFTAGNPIGLGVYFSKGILSKRESIRKDCGLVASGFTAGVVPGQTGSGVFKTNGELVGVVIAVSAIPISSEGDGSKVTMHVPIYGIGHFVPLSYIKSFLN